MQSKVLLLNGGANIKTNLYSMHRNEFADESDIADGNKMEQFSQIVEESPNAISERSSVRERIDISGRNEKRTEFEVKRSHFRIDKLRFAATSAHRMR